MNKRISILIDTLKIKKVDFAKKISVSAPFISELCSGAKSPSDRTIADICREFNVREEWLRNGTGEMFIHRTLAQEIAAFLGDVTSDTNDFKYRLISVLARMSPDQWSLLEQIANDLADETKKAAP